MRRIAFGLACMLAAIGGAAAAEQVKFTVQSPQWGKVQFVFNGVKACATNRGERMCGTASKVPRPGEAFTMNWGWPQKQWKRP